MPRGFPTKWEARWEVIKRFQATCNHARRVTVVRTRCEAAGCNLAWLALSRSIHWYNNGSNMLNVGHTYKRGGNDYDFMGLW